MRAASVFMSGVACLLFLVALVRYARTRWYEWLPGWHIFLLMLTAVLAVSLKMAVEVAESQPPFRGVVTLRIAMNVLFIGVGTANLVAIVLLQRRGVFIARTPAPDQEQENNDGSAGRTQSPSTV